MSTWRNCLPKVPSPAELTQSSQVISVSHAPIISFYMPPPSPRPPPSSPFTSPSRFSSFFFFFFLFISAVFSHLPPVCPNSYTADRTRLMSPHASEPCQLCQVGPTPNCSLEPAKGPREDRYSAPCTRHCLCLFARVWPSVILTATPTYPLCRI